MIHKFPNGWSIEQAERLIAAYGRLYFDRKAAEDAAAADAMQIDFLRQAVDQRRRRRKSNLWFYCVTLAIQLPMCGLIVSFASVTTLYPMLLLATLIMCITASCMQLFSLLANNQADELALRMADIILDNVEVSGDRASELVAQC